MSTLKLLVLFPRRLWNTKVSPVRRHSILAMGRRDDVTLHVSGADWPDYDLTRTPEQNRRRIMPDSQAVLLYKPEGTKEVPYVGDPQTLKVPAVLRYNEAWWPDGKASLEAISAWAKLVIIHHEVDRPQFDDAVKATGCQVVHVPHCAEKIVFADAARPHAKRDLDVVLTGVLSAEVYPLRDRFVKLIDSGALRPLKTLVYRHPGYRKPDMKACDKAVRDYADVLGRSKVALVTGSRYRYPMAKYVEAAMAGCALVGDMPLKAPAGYEWFYDLSPTQDLSDEQWAGLIRTAVANTQAGQANKKVAVARFTQERYAEDFVEAVRSVL